MFKINTPLANEGLRNMFGALTLGVAMASCAPRVSEAEYPKNSLSDLIRDEREDRKEEAALLRGEISKLLQDKKELEERIELYEEDDNRVGTENLPLITHEINVKGNLEVGRVITYRQMHPVEASGFWEERVDAHNARAIRNQRSILKDLLERKPDFAIPEAHVKKSEMNELMSQLKVNSLLPKLVRSENWDYLTPQENEEFDRLLLEAGAMTAYPYINSRAKLQTTEGYGQLDALYPELQNVYERIMDLYTEIRDKRRDIREKGDEEDTQEIKLLAKEYDRLRARFIYGNNERERIMADLATRLLRKYPGKTVAIAMGAGHNLCDDFEQIENGPQMESVTFPRDLLDNDPTYARYAVTTCVDWIDTTFPESKKLRPSKED